MKRLTIAIDGKSSCGKSTLAKALANALGYIYVDTGAMYRGVAWYALSKGWITDDKIEEEKLIEALSKIELTFLKVQDEEKASLFVNNVNVEPQIRSIEVANVVSQVAAIKEVRVYLVNLQRKMGEHGGVVMDGRDIGSVVFPTAEVKLFVTAKPKIRAQRRFDELKAKGDDVSFDEVKKNILKRDELDENRKESPLIKTADAIALDNSYLNPEEQLEVAMEIVKNKLLRN